MLNPVLFYEKAVTPAQTISPTGFIGPTGSGALIPVHQAKK